MKKICTFYSAYDIIFPGMDPKQTSPLGGTPGGGQEGQNPSSVSAGANSGASPVFSSGTDSAPAGTPASDQKMPGTLGAENLSTGANVSRTMDSLNSKNQSETGTSVFSKHKFDRAEPDGSILIPESKGLFFRKSRGDKDNDVTGSMIAARGESVDGLDPETRRKRRMLRIGGIVGGALALILVVVIVVVLVAAPRREKVEAPITTQVSAAQIRAAFEDYLSYLFYGNDSGTEESFKKTWNAYMIEGPTAIYAEEQLLKPFSDDRSSYFNDLENKWKSFTDIYSSELVSAESLAYPSIYFYSFSSVDNPDASKVLEIYKENGVDAANSQIDLISKGYNEVNFVIQDYMSAKQTFLRNWLSTIEQLDSEGCLNDNGQPTCKEDVFNEFILTPENLSEYVLSEEIKNNMRENAMVPIQVAYADIFNLIEEMEEEADI
ncbi:hypothetical protein IJG91_01920 [Candidatus Saccharibacteria bacterium]|nr:hypothetical protein [Candidatus Saccharibacteria bacterium]